MLTRAQERGEDQARRCVDRGDQRQYRHRPGDGGGNDGLSHAAGDAGASQHRAAPVHESVWRGDRPHVKGRGHGGSTGCGRAHARRGPRNHRLDQFASPDNPRAHYEGTAPEIWRDTGGKITHLVSSMGTTGTIMGCSRYFKEKNPGIRIIGVQPEEGAQIPGIRKWPEAYLPKIYDARRVDQIMLVSQTEAEETTRQLAREEGIFAGISSGGALAAALKISAATENATIVSIVCDRGRIVIFPPVFSRCSDELWLNPSRCFVAPGGAGVPAAQGVDWS